MIKAFLNNIKVDNYLKQELIDYLTVNETYFYREFRQIDEPTKLKAKSRLELLKKDTYSNIFLGHADH